VLPQISSACIFPVRSFSLGLHVIHLVPFQANINGQLLFIRGNVAMPHLR